MSSVQAKILKQVEFYFGDSNLPRDKFLKELTQKNDGYVPIATLASFARMKKLTTDVDVIVASLKESKSLLEVDADGKNVRRTTPLTDATYNENVWVYAKGFPQEMELEALEEYFRIQGTVKCVRMRRYGESKFKGSVFVEFGSEEEAKKFLSEEHKVPNGTGNLQISSKSTYVAEKKKQYLDRQAEKEAKQKAVAEQEAKDAEEDAAPMKDPVLNLLIKITGVPNTTSREDLSEAVDTYGGHVKYVDFTRGITEGIVRVQDDDPKGAKALVKELTEAKCKICGVVPTYTALEGEVETKYWSDLWEKQKRNKKLKRKMGGRRGGRSNKRFRR